MSRGIVEMLEVKEHEDGSATYTFDLSKDLSELCGAFGLKLLMYCGALGKSPDYAFDLLGKQLEDKFAEELGKDHEPT
jgi:hypothetical protein